MKPVELNWFLSLSQCLILMKPKDDYVSLRWRLNKGILSYSPRRINTFENKSFIDSKIIALWISSLSQYFPKFGSQRDTETYLLQWSCLELFQSMKRKWILHVLHLFIFHHKHFAKYIFLWSFVFSYLYISYCRFWEKTLTYLLLHSGNISVVFHISMSLWLYCENCIRSSI